MSIIAQKKKRTGYKGGKGSNSQILYFVTVQRFQTNKLQRRLLRASVRLQCFRGSIFMFVLVEQDVGAGSEDG